MITHKEVEEYLLSLPNTRLDYPFGPEAAVYKVAVTGSSSRSEDPSTHLGQEKMFALVAEKSQPVRISLKCDPLLAETLREKYESVMPGYHLNKKHWNTIVCSGQLSWDEIQDLIRHSYQLVTSGNQ